MNKTERINVRVEPELLAVIKIAAKKENRTVSSYIENVLKIKLEKEQVLIGRIKNLQAYKDKEQD